MVGSIGPRMLAITLPHVDAWNVWWTDYGNTVEGFAAVRARVEEAATRAGRGPGEVAASAAVLVQLPDGTGRLTGTGHGDDPDPVPLGSLGSYLDGLTDAGADEVQLVLDPITADSITAVGEALGLA